MARYRWDRARGRLVQVGPAVVGRAPGAPSIRRDQPGYVSPVTGRWIGGRAARREDLAASGCREVDPSEKPA